MQTYHVPRATADVIATLNSLLRDERSALASYRQARRAAGVAHADDIEVNLASHARRVVLLARRIIELGGQPADEGGLWSPFARAVDSGSGFAFAALEQSEEQMLEGYHEALDGLDPLSLHLMLGTLLPEQKRTHQRISAIEAALVR